MTVYVNAFKCVVFHACLHVYMYAYVYVRMHVIFVHTKNTSIYVYMQLRILDAVWMILNMHNCNSIRSTTI